MMIGKKTAQECDVLGLLRGNLHFCDTEQNCITSLGM